MAAEARLRSAITKPLFAGDAREDSPALKSLRVLLEAVPEHALLEALRAARGKGRADSPVAVLWGTLLLAIALRHVSVDACLEERKRTPALRLLRGSEAADDVPGPANLARFLATLGDEPHVAHLRALCAVPVPRRGQVVGDFGKDTAGAATGLSGRAAVSTPLRAAESEQGLPQPSGGRKEYQDEDGTVTHVVEWFGYKLPLLVDVQHEGALADPVTDTKAGANERLPERVAQAHKNLPAARRTTWAYAKAAAADAVHEVLHAEAITPVMQNRNGKVAEPEKVLGGRTPLNVVYDQAGTVFCDDKVSATPVRHPLAYRGHEAERGTRK